MVWNIQTHHLYSPLPSWTSHLSATSIQDPFVCLPCSSHTTKQSIKIDLSYHTSTQILARPQVHLQSKWDFPPSVPLHDPSGPLFSPAPTLTCSFRTPLLLLLHPRYTPISGLFCLCYMTNIYFFVVISLCLNVTFQIMHTWPWVWYWLLQTPCVRPWASPA